MNAQARQWIEALGLAPHPEGGHFREVFRSTDLIPAAGLPARYGAPRCAATSIYFLLEGRDRSRLHRLRSDEIWYHHAGGVLAIAMILPDGRRADVRLGASPDGDARPQAVLPRGAWFGARLESETGFALIGCAVAPGFEFADFELGRRDDLLAAYPQHRDLIGDLAPP
ncbi:MAG: cupin domain-containing protein [Lentisphaerae bacterium]|nr:cupin domain-containing protein [Lentisphaerota bacterium]